MRYYRPSDSIWEHESDCEDCGEAKGYEAGSSNVVQICHNCGAGKEDEASASEEI